MFLNAEGIIGAFLTLWSPLTKWEGQGWGGGLLRMAPTAGLESEGLSPLVACCHKDTTTFGLRTLASCGKSQVVDLKPEDVVSETSFNTHSLKGLDRSFLLIYAASINTRQVTRLTFHWAVCPS